MKSKKEHGNIIFIHSKTKEETTFSWARNNINNSMMYWFSNIPAMYAGTMPEIKGIIKKLKESEGFISQNEESNHPSN